MRKRAKSIERTQAGRGLLLTVQQLMLSMIEGIARSKQGLLEWVHQVGLSALSELFERDAEQIAGPRGKHSKERSHYRWGSARAELPLGGRRIVVRRPRVRSRSGQEARLATVEHFQRVDPVPARVLNQILLGVSTRGYERSLEPRPAGVLTRGTSKSAASRHLIARMTDELRQQLSRRLDDLDLLVLMLDGVAIARRAGSGWPDYRSHQGAGRGRVHKGDTGAASGQAVPAASGAPRVHTEGARPLSRARNPGCSGPSHSRRGPYGTRTDFRSELLRRVVRVSAGAWLS